MLARIGDKEAFGVLITLYEPMALRIAQRFVRDHDTGRELVQEAMLQAYLSLGHLRDTTSFKNWFYGIVLNVCRNYLREHKRINFSLEAMQVELVDEQVHLHAISDGVRSPQEEVEERELHQVMLLAIEQLSAKNRAVILLFYYGQWTLREVAEILHVSVAVVKSRLTQARKELRERLLISYPEMQPATIHIMEKKLMVSVVIAEVIQTDPSSIIVLVDEPKKQVLPIWIGYWEGQAIASMLQNTPTVGPLTFTFTANLLQASRGKLEEVRLELLKEDLLYAIAVLRHDNASEEVESRPGEALALAAQVGCRITVAENVLEKMGLQVRLEQGKLSPTDLEAILAHIRKNQPQQPASPLTTSDISYYKPPRTPRNLNGEDGTAGWLMAGNHAQNYVYVSDRTTGYGSAGSLMMRAKLATTGGFGMLMQMISADDYRSKRVNFSGYTRVSQIDQPVLFCLYAYGSGGVLRQEFTAIEAVAAPAGQSDTADEQTASVWQPFDVTLDVPDDCARLGFGTMLRGMGQVWISTLSLTAKDLPLTVASGPTRADQPHNLDFSQGAVDWELMENGTHNYICGIDTVVTYSGTGSLYLKNKHAYAEGQAYLMQTLKTSHYQGKRLRISGQIQCKGVVAWGGLWIIVNGQNGGLIYNSNVQQRAEHDLRLIGTRDWQRYEVVLDVPAKSTSIGFGLGLMGTGQLWLDDVRFEIVGEDVPTTTV